MIPDLRPSEVPEGRRRPSEAFCSPSEAFDGLPKPSAGFTGSLRRPPKAAGRLRTPPEAFGGISEAAGVLRRAPVFVMCRIRWTLRRGNLKNQKIQKTKNNTKRKLQKTKAPGPQRTVRVWKISSELNL